MKFEVGKKYESADWGLSKITILKRTAKSVKVSNGDYEWMMRIRVDENGDEYVQDSSAGRKWVEAFTFKACWEVK